MKRAYAVGTLLLVVAGAGAVCYLSWLPDPMLSKYDILPDPVARWSDQRVNENRRTAIPFVALSLLVSSYLLVRNADWRWWLYNWLGLVCLVFVAEAGQLLLPQRSFDWYDITWGAAGALGGLIPLALLRLVSQAVSARPPRRNNLFFL